MPPCPPGRTRILVAFLFLFSLLSCTVSYHRISDNLLYHCWWYNASKSNPDPVPCPGISIDWVEEPPSTVGVGVHFNVSYHVVVTQAYYESRFGFEGRNYNTPNASALEQFCHNSPCPESDSSNSRVFKLNCCVWHANIHVCHPGECGRPDQICGPWVDNDQVQSTHTKATYGNIDDVFTAEIHIDAAGQNYMIAHVKLGEMQMAIQKIVTVYEYFCGDNRCSDNEDCESCSVDCCSSLPVSARAAIGVVASLLLLIVLVFIVLGVVWFYYQKRKLFYDESWIIDYSLIKGLERGYGGLLGSMVSLRNMKFLSGDEKTGDSAVSVMDVNTGKKQMFTQTGNYEGRTVAIKRISQSGDFQLTKSIRKEVMQVRTLDHANLCKFVGATVRSPGNLAIISEYCPKGSLNDVLQNEDIPLNWGFRFSFATDIARGMAYLHSKKIYHSRLRSTNCVIDDRWVVKITDYGIPSLRTRDIESDAEEGDTRSDCLIYCSPEDRSQKYPQPTQAGNVYSFSVIMLEIATRMDPYSEELFVDSKGRPKVPDLTQDGCPCPEKYEELVKRCWDDTPANRPSFDQIKKSVHRMNPNHESPVDMMMIMMEKYSKHLEALVGERTQELIIEQNKTQQLLYSMLPKAVADELRQGRQTSAQQFRSVTIYFSDIVGFTNLAGDSSPMEVVNLLNELYSTFDDILDKFDVYKVETIGDAYMVVSGVPRINGDRHAGEIARMALKLVDATDSFKIPHRPNTKLRIRVGIHSGPVCAGVVGLKMPRYCLFGDTVNTASRMESNSEAMRIHCSESTAQLLKKTGGFQLECRGTMSIKGKGMMTTWWLEGVDSESCTSLITSHPSSQNNNKKTENDDIHHIKLSANEAINLPGSAS